MDLATAIERLEAAGTEQNRKPCRRHGARAPLLGVSFAMVDRLAQEAGRDWTSAQGTRGIRAQRVQSGATRWSGTSYAGRAC